tara:strand:- start:29788 stop:30588 length:801 start_codon:yes stop_codon:yes gene_type:complete
MADYTVTYSEGAKGFPSFYSYYPDWMIGMNNFFYSFNGGNLYRHNTNSVRNEYYGSSAIGSKITGIFNDAPIADKLFKTLQLESNDTWKADVVSDKQSGEVQSAWFEEKESDWFAFIRYFDPDPASPAQYPLRSVNGLGFLLNAVETPPASGIYVITFAAGVSVGSIISNGDQIYGSPTLTPTTIGAPVLRGAVTAHDQASITVDTNVVGGSAPSVVPADFISYFKNNLAESHGILGHYMEFTLTNNNTEAVELFSISSDVMKSYP